MTKDILDKIGEVLSEGAGLEVGTDIRTTDYIEIETPSGFQELEIGTQGRIEGVYDAGYYISFDNYEDVGQFSVDKDDVEADVDAEVDDIDVRTDTEKRDSIDVIKKRLRDEPIIRN